MPEDVLTQLDALLEQEPVPTPEPEREPRPAEQPLVEHIEGLPLGDLPGRLREALGFEPLTTKQPTAAEQFRKADILGVAIETEVTESFALSELDRIGRQATVRMGMDRMGAFFRSGVLEGRDPKQMLKDVVDLFRRPTPEGNFEVEPIWDATGPLAARAALGWAQRAYGDKKTRALFTLAGDYARGDIFDPQPLLSLSRKDRDRTLRFLFEQATPQDRRLPGKIGASVGRRTDDFLNALPGFLSEFSNAAVDQELLAEQNNLKLSVVSLKAAKFLGIGKKEFLVSQEAKLKRVTEQVDTQKKAAQEAEWTIRQVKRIRESADPLTGDNFLEQGLIDVAGMLPNLVASAVFGAAGGPVAAAAWWVPQIATETLDEFRLEGIEINDTTRAVALLGSIPEAAIEVIQIKGLTAGLRRGMNSAVKASVGKFLRGFIKKAGVNWTRELGEEFLQGLNRIATKSMATFLDEKAPGVDFGRELGQLAVEMKRAGVSLGILLLPGEIIGGVRGVRAIQQVRGLEAAEQVQAKLLDDMVTILSDETTKQSDRNLVERNIAKVIKGQELAPSLQKRIEALAQEKEKAEVRAAITEEVVPEEEPAAKILAEKQPVVEEVPVEEPTPPPKERVPVVPAPPPLPAERKGEPKVAKAKAEVKAILAEPVSAKQVVLSPEVAAEDAAQVAKDATAAQVLTEQEIRITGKDIGVRVFESGDRGKRGGASEIGSSYIIRHKDFKEDIPLEDLFAAQLAEPDQQIDQLIEAVKALQEDAGRDFVERTLTRFSQMAPQTAKKRAKLFNALDFQPKVGGEAGGLSAEVVGAEFSRLRKILTPGLAKQIMQDVTFWREGTPINVTPRKLEAFVTRARVSPKRAFFIGAVSTQMTNKQLVDFVKENLPAREHKMIAAALEKVAKSRTPGERIRVVQAVSQMIERHEKASAILGLKDAEKAAQKTDLRAEFKQALGNLLADVALKTPRPKTIQRAAAVMARAETEAAQQIKDLGVDPEETFSTIPVETIRRARKALSQVGRRSLIDLSVAELRELQAGVEMIVAQSKLKDRIWAFQTTKTADEKAKDSAAVVTERHGAKFVDRRGMGIIARGIKALHGFAGFFVESSQDVVYRMGGDSSIIEDILHTNIREGVSETQGIYDTNWDAFRADLEANNVPLKDLRAWSKSLAGSTDVVEVSLPDAGKVKKMTRAERMNFLMNWLDPETRAELLRNKQEGIVFVGDVRPTKITARDAQAIIDSMDSREKTVARLGGRLVNGPLKEALNRFWRRLFGPDIATGERHWRRERARRTQPSDPNVIIRETVRQLPEQWGGVKARSRTDAPFVIRDFFEVLDEQIAQTANIIGKTAPIHDALRLLNNEGFQIAVKEGMIDGPAALAKVRTAILNVAGDQRPHLSLLERGILAMTRGFGVAKLALNIPVWGYQALSFPLGIMEMPGKVSAEGQLMSNKENLAEIDATDPLLRARIRGSGHGITTIGNSTSRLRQQLSGHGWLTRVNELGMKGIHAIDTQVMYRLRAMARSSAKAEGLTGEPLMRQTRLNVWKSIDRSQPSSDPLVISPLQQLARKTPLARLIPGVMFSTMRNKLNGIVIRAASDFAASGYSSKAIPKFAGRVAMATVINAIGLALISVGWKTLKRGMPEGDEEKELWVRAFIVSVIKRTTGSFLVVGEGFNFLVSLMDIKTRPGRKIPWWYAVTSDNVLTSSMRLFAEAFSETFDAFNDDDGRQRWSPRRRKRAAPHWRKAISAWMRFLGDLTGIPFGLVERDVKDLMKRWEQKQRGRRR